MSQALQNEIKRMQAEFGRCFSEAEKVCSREDSAEQLWAKEYAFEALNSIRVDNESVSIPPDAQGCLKLIGTLREILSQIEMVEQKVKEFTDRREQEIKELEELRGEDSKRVEEIIRLEASLAHTQGKLEEKQRVFHRRRGALRELFLAFRAKPACLLDLEGGETYCASAVERLREIASQSAHTRDSTPAEKAVIAQTKPSTAKRVIITAAMICAAIWFSAPLWRPPLLFKYDSLRMRRASAEFDKLLQRPRDLMLVIDGDSVKISLSQFLLDEFKRRFPASMITMRYVENGSVKRLVAADNQIFRVLFDEICGGGRVDLHLDLPLRGTHNAGIDSPAIDLSEIVARLRLRGLCK